jgi:hypothetical protein
VSTIAALALVAAALPAEARSAGTAFKTLPTFDSGLVSPAARAGTFRGGPAMRGPGGPSFRGPAMRFGDPRLGGPWIGARSFRGAPFAFRGRHFRGRYFPYFAGVPFAYGYYCRRVLVPWVTPSGRVLVRWVRRCPGWYPYSAYWWW